VSKDEAEPVLFRAEAVAMETCLKMQQGEQEDAAEGLRTVFDMIATATPEEMARLVQYSHDNGSNLSTKPVSFFLEEQESYCRSTLQRLEDPTRGSQWPVDGPDAELMRRLAAGGNKCDCCGMKRNDVIGVHVLLRCSRCQLAYYCLSACQQKQWKAGHKKCCRAPGDIKVGDSVRVKGLVSRAELNMQTGEVI